MSGRAIVLDANILVRAVLGSRVRNIILANAATVKLFAPDVAYSDARKYLPSILAKRGVDGDAALLVVDQLELVVQRIDLDLYAGMQQQALARIGARDANDWPVLACAMAIGCPVWTEDTDFFGTGVPIWTTDRVELYFQIM